MLRGDKKSFHIQVVAAFESPVDDVLAVEAYDNEGAKKDVDQNLFLGAGEHVHTCQHRAHREAASRSLEGSVCMGSPLALLAVRDFGGDHTSAHEEGSQVVDIPDHPPPLSK